MAEEEGGKEEDKGKKRFAFLPMVGLALLFLLVGLGAGYGVANFLGGSAGKAKEAEGEEGASAEEGTEEAVAEEGGEGHEAAAEEGGEAGKGEGHEKGKAAPKTGPQVKELGSFTVNLRDSAGSRLLLMEISVECPAATASRVEARKAQISDTINLLAADYTYIELDGLDGRMRLKDELLRRINAVLAPDKCDRLYFTSFVVQ